MAEDRKDPWYEEYLFLLYRTIILYDEEDFFELIGLPRNVTFDKYMAHYGGDEETVIDRAGDDIFSYPPLAEKLRQSAKESGITVELVLHQLTEGIERCKRDVEKHGRAKDRRALKKGLALLDEVLEVGKFQKH